MTLSDEVKQKIQAEYDAWQEHQYAGKDKKQRQANAQFFTPPSLTIKMLEKFKSLSGSVLDPCLGAGGLIAAAVIAGADPTSCYGIEIDPEILKVAQRRLARLGVPPCNLIEGDALDPQSYEKLQPFTAEVFAAVSKLQDREDFQLVVAKRGSPVREVICSREKANEVLKKLKSTKNAMLFKI